MSTQPAGYESARRGDAGDLGFLNRAVRFARSINFDCLQAGRLEHTFFALNLRRLFVRSLLLNHLATAFEDAALFDHERRSLNVAIQFSGATQLNALAGDDVTVHYAVNRGDRDFDVRVNLAARAHQQ